MSKKIPLAGKLFAAICVPIVGVAVFYSPMLTALGWHMVHGQVVDYRGLRVEVPWGWTADLNSMREDYPANPQGITLQKPPKTLNLESRGPEMIYINLLLPDARNSPQQQAEEWQSLFRQSHPGSEFDMATPSSFPSDAECLEATPRSTDQGMQSGAAMACISLHGEWLANFAGSQASIPLFRQIVSALKP